MKRTLLMIIALVIVVASCKKSKSSPSGDYSAMAGFWTYKTDPNNSDNYWNDNVLFLSNGTFRMYTALSLDDTAAAQAIKDTAGQVVTFGTYTVSGTTLKMVLSEFGGIGITAEGSVNSSHTMFNGVLEVTSDPNSANPLWILTKP